MKKTTKYIRTAVLTIMLSLPVISFAQGPGFDPGVTDTPIDGGATMMLVAAAGYGAKKLADKRKKGSQ